MAPLSASASINDCYDACASIASAAPTASTSCWYIIWSASSCVLGTARLTRNQTYILGMPMVSTVKLPVPVAPVATFTSIGPPSVSGPLPTHALAPSSNAVSRESSSSSNQPAIIGGIIAAVLSLVILVVAIWFLMRRNKEKCQSTVPTRQPHPRPDVPIEHPGAISSVARSPTYMEEALRPMQELAPFKFPGPAAESSGLNLHGQPSHATEVVRQDTLASPPPYEPWAANKMFPE
ncbi:hypothetical protein HKX48_003730 [Thoreauomyces humboldtii]|nr:hypothetical protein HKX48_003730 [Thoreauomyces humboldtii]